MNKNCFFVSLFVVGIVVMGMFLVANNGHDVFTSFWSLFGKLVSFSQSVKWHNNNSTKLCPRFLRTKRIHFPCQNWHWKTFKKPTIIIKRLEIQNGNNHWRHSSFGLYPIFISCYKVRQKWKWWNFRWKMVTGFGDITIPKQTNSSYHRDIKCQWKTDGFST